MSNPYFMPTLYAVIAPKAAVLQSVQWPEKPGLKTIQSLVEPLLCEFNQQKQTDMERVRWFYNGQYLDLFVDEIGGPQFRYLPVNDLATKLYHNNVLTFRPELAQAGAIAPIYGTAIVFFRQVWF